MDLPTRFRELFEPALIEEMAREGRARHVPAGESLLEPGLRIQWVPILLSGLVKVSRVEPDGRELFLYYVNPDESCAMTFTCCREDETIGIRAVAEADADLVFFPARATDDWLAKYPSWKRFVMRTIRGRFNELLCSIDLIAFRNLDQRLAAFLRDKARAQGSTLINLSHEAVAVGLASSRVAVSRLLKKLERDGKVILYRNQIKILGEL